MMLAQHWFRSLTSWLLVVALLLGAMPRGRAACEAQKEPNGARTCCCAAKATDACCGHGQPRACQCKHKGETPVPPRVPSEERPLVLAPADPRPPLVGDDGPRDDRSPYRIPERNGFPRHAGVPLHVEFEVFLI